MPRVGARGRSRGGQASGGSGAARGIGEAGERLKICQALPALLTPLPLPADRAGEADLERDVEVLVGVGEDATEQPVDLVRRDGAQRNVPGEVDVADVVDGERDAVHACVAREQEAV